MNIHLKKSILSAYLPAYWKKATKKWLSGTTTNSGQKKYLLYDDRTLINQQGTQSNKKVKGRLSTLKILGRIMSKTRSNTSELYLYSIKEACNVLSVGRTTLNELCNSGRLTKVYIGRSARIPQESIECFCRQLIDEANLFRSKNPCRWS
jgi:excisionase family DNA binding protein